MQADQTDHSFPLPNAFFLILLIALTLGASSSSTLEANLNSVIQNGNAGSAFWGLDVRDAETGEVLYSHNNTRRFLPASNQKVLTTATALDALGRDYRYETGLYFEGDIDGDVLRGDLIIKGSGDPTLGSREIPVSNPLRSWARQLAQMGITRIEGRIIGDDSAFDRKRYAEGWDVDYVMSQSSHLLGVSISGLSYRDNLVHVRVESGGANSSVDARTFPVGVFEIDNHLSVSPRRSGRSIQIERGVGIEGVRLSGSLPTNYRGTLLVPILNPPIFASASLKSYFDDAGIDVSGATAMDLGAMHDPPEDVNDSPIFVHYSPPLSEILNVINKESNNFYADQVFRTFGWRGSADGAENRVNALLERAGIDTRPISIRDGSGLSRKNLISPADMSKLLLHMRDHRHSEPFIESLPRGGEPNTTLRYRLSGVDVQAKTGALEFARSLSGYTTLPDGREVVFTFFVNNYDGPSYRSTQLLDRLVATMTS